MYLMRWPVFRLIWLKLIFSESEVAGYKATGQVTSERRKKPFQLARGAIQKYSKLYRTRIQDDLTSLVPTIIGRHTIPNGLLVLAELGWFCSEIRPLLTSARLAMENIK
jgi:hypothetical protein